MVGNISGGRGVLVGTAVGAGMMGGGTGDGSTGAAGGVGAGPPGVVGIPGGVAIGVAITGGAPFAGGVGVTGSGLFEGGGLNGGWVGTAVNAGGAGCGLGPPLEGVVGVGEGCVGEVGTGAAVGMGAVGEVGRGVAEGSGAGAVGTGVAGFGAGNVGCGAGTVGATEGIGVGTTTLAPLKAANVSSEEAISIASDDGENTKRESRGDTTTPAPCGAVNRKFPSLDEITSYESGTPSTRTPRLTPSSGSPSLSTTVPETTTLSNPTC